MIFVDVDTGFGKKDYLIDEKVKCSEVIKELTGSGSEGYRLWDSSTGVALREDMTLYEQSITSGSRLRLRRFLEEGSV